LSFAGLEVITEVADDGAGIHLLTPVLIPPCRRSRGEDLLAVEVPQFAAYKGPLVPGPAQGAEAGYLARAFGNDFKTAGVRTVF